MKRYLLIMMVIVAVLAGVATAEAKKNKNDGGEGKIEFSEKVYDFGKIKENGGLVTHEFKYVNNGDGNLVILKATAECGCTRPTFNDAPTAPGKSGKLKVSYNPKGRPGSFEKVVTVTATGSPRKVRLKIRGYVVE